MAGIHFKSGRRPISDLFGSLLKNSGYTFEHWVSASFSGGHVPLFISPILTYLGRYRGGKSKV